MRLLPAKPLDEILEKELQAQVFELAQVLGWRKGYHTFDSRRSHSGFPDIVLVRERVVFLELKRENGRLSDAQREWMHALFDANAEVYVIRPRNLERLAVVLQERHHRPHADDELAGELLRELGPKT